ncbi:hypothetical protein N9954_08145 [Maribacter sp.]|nr:hypothetical protein [Maribacter sp.]
MRNTAFIITLLFLLNSCGSTIQLPVSNEVPAAVMTVKQKQDGNNNFTIKLTAENLASADRLSPSRATYVVWIETDENGIKNVGQLNPENGEKVDLETVSSFEPKAIFVTAEDEGNVSLPTGTEITRKSF